VKTEKAWETEMNAAETFGKGSQKLECKSVVDWAGVFLISNIRHVLNVVCFLLGNSPASEFYMPTFRNPLSVPSSEAVPPMKMEQTDGSERSAYKIQTPENYPEESIQHGQV
jgi:hypothetical protein